MESLTKYVPFVDFLLKTDRKKYFKFFNIKKWILSKKTYPSNVMNKIEEAVLTQYKNLLLENKVQIPQHITDTFAPSINLCSDDEEDNSQNKKENRVNNSAKIRKNGKHSKPKQDSFTLKLDDDDDDLEFVSIDYIDNATKKTEDQPVKENKSKEEFFMDQASKDIFNKIDQLAADDIKSKIYNHEPVNYTYKLELETDDTTVENDKDIFQRRNPSTDILFKRRTDFKDNEVVVSSLNDGNTVLLDSAKQMETISLDSDSESEVCNDGERPSTSTNAAILSNKNVEETSETNLVKPVSDIENTDSNSNSSNNANKLELLCKTIEAVLPEMSAILNEVEEANNQQIEKPVLVKKSTKQVLVKKNVEVKNKTPNLDPEQISKILEDISSKTDFEMDTFYEALQYVREMNSEQKELPESPPPAPPLITETNVTATPVQPCLENQQQTQQPQIEPSLTPHNDSNVNFVPKPAMVPPPKPKLNINDPRIKKQLQVIKNSPIFSYNILNNDLEESIRKICHDTVMQTSILNINTNNTNPSQSKNCAPGTNKSSITYGEYKRRQLEKKLEMERKREEERKAKIKAQLEIEEREKREKLEQAKSNEEKEIRSKILSTLSPCKGKIFSLLKRTSDDVQIKPHKQNTQIKESSNNVKELINNSNSLTHEKQQKENVHSTEANKAKKLKENSNSATNNKQSKTKKHTNSEQKLNRVYNELKCTFKGFDTLQDYIVEETNINSNEMQTSARSSPLREEEETATRLVGLRRRSSMHALSAITEQLCLQSDYSDSDLSQNSSKPRSKNWSHNSSSENLSQDSLYPAPKRRRTDDEVIKPSRRTKNLRITCDETSSQESSSDDEVAKQKQLRKTIFKRVPVLKLHRLSEEFIRKHTKRNRKDSEKAPTINLEQSVRLKKTSEIVESLQEPSQKIPKLKKYNNDCQMTERNTAFCVLCRSKPTDLTNHYKGRHKTESYVSRLDWSDLEDLAVNTHFAILQPSSKNYRFERYEIECPFCKEKIIDQFINLYNHYSLHTGEYAFQCSHCNLAKPYKPDIQSHILHSKTCRNSSIQVMYRYPPQAQCIYLHYCRICNFVQLNEANVLKHLREHHDSSKAITRNVQKCLLAAISDGPDTYKKSPSPLLTTEANNTTALNEKEKPPCVKSTETIAETETPTTLQTEFKVDDDDIPVSNEPCLEDELLDDQKYSCEDMLRYLHEETAKTAQPMTIIHNLGPNIQQDTTQTTASQVNPQQNAIATHQPKKIKTEAKENTEEGTQEVTPPASTQPKPRAVGNLDMVYEKYRSYPPNVNYLGLFKCMIDDCYYSTDCTNEIVKHLTEHSTDSLKPNQYLQCPYCILILDTSITPTQLVDHVRTQHGHLNFQCSLCCYRSCDASNVHLHQKMHHSNVLNTCQIYKSSIGDFNLSSKENINLNEKIENNIFKIACKLCFKASFYHTKLLIEHLYNEHNLTSAKSLNIYSCINCPFTVDNQNQLRIHIAIKHPAERPLIYDHNSQINSVDEDSKSCSNVIDISEPVPYIETTNSTTTDAGNEEHLSQDIKPNFKELMLMNEETAKVRLRKLTSHTGIASDNLYRCPEQSCGGFFSVFDLWLRHMKVRHLALECQCPHCPTALLMPLEHFALHFEQHRRHTYICFYCSTTSPTETLARKHAAQNHSEIRTMRFEKICFNISYSYYIMIQSELFEEREKFIAELLTILDKRLKVLETNEIKNLKQQWPVRDNTPWLDDYLQSLPNRKVARRCLVKDCDFRTLKEENLYRHLSTSHTITGTQFNCSKCEYRVEKCHNLDELFNHIKLHNEYHFICAACNLVTSSRPKMSAHIEQQHTARDVPVIHLFRTRDQMYHKMYIVFADDHITFSTMKNCFCCSEQNMSGDVFSLHLKRYHNLHLSYYCEKCTNFGFNSLKEVHTHFEQFHQSDKFKIRCELAGRSDLHVLSLSDFQIQILSTPLSVSQQTKSSISIKTEPLDVSDNDNVVLIEDDDVVIENSVKAAQQRQTELPKLKCASFSKLSETNINSEPSPQTQQTENPISKKCASTWWPEPNTNNLHSTPTFLSVTVPTIPVAATTPASSSTLAQGYYNLNQQNLTTNKSMNNVNALNRIPATAVNDSNSYLLYNKTVIRPVMPNSNSTSIQIRSLPLNVNANTHLNANAQNLPNNLYIDQARCDGSTNQTNNVQMSNFVNAAYSVMPQNYEYNNTQLQNSNI